MIGVLFRLFLCFGLVSLAESKEVSSPVQKPIVGVYAAWQHESFPSTEIVWEKLSHIAVASIYPLETADLDTSYVDPFVDELVSLAKVHNKKTILSVGGAGIGSKAFKTIMADNQQAAKLVANIVAYTHQHNFDGVDIDWEYWTYQQELNKGGNDPIESQYLVDLLKMLRQALPPTKMLTVDIAPGNWLGAQYKPELQEYADYVNLMAFDFTGAWDGSKVAHHAAYSTFKKAIRHTLNKGFTANKLLVGIPAYGKEFVAGNTDVVNKHAYNDIVTKLYNDKATLRSGRVDNVFFETRNLVEKKSRYIINKQLAGVFVFDLASDSTDEAYSLVGGINVHIVPVDNEL